MDSGGLHQSEQTGSFYFPEHFKDVLETLVVEILRDRPDDPLQFASEFFTRKLKHREELKAAEPAQNVLEEQAKPERPDEKTGQPCHELNQRSSAMSPTQAATIIQAHFRRYNLRQNQWKKRFLVTKLNFHDDMVARGFLDSPRDSFSLYASDDDLCHINYDSDQSLEEAKLF